MEITLRDLVRNTSFGKAGDFVEQYGQEILLAAAIFLIGLIAVKFFLVWLKKTLLKFTENQQLASMVITGVNIALIVLVLSVALHFLGMRDIVIRRLLIAVTLVVIAFMVLLKPYIPNLPFKIGNTVEIGGILGKVEAITFTYTRLKTFDGKTLFVPNQMLFKSVINNYHFTPTRRVRVKVTIGYKDDLVKAKEVIKQLMTDDERVLKKPAPAVSVIDLGDNGVELSARCWVNNLKYFTVWTGLMEKVKLAFDKEGITIAFPQRDVHLVNESEPPSNV
jgi:small conductance mechanosensitive channel